jgi:iron(III) transport system substrate-binding protein
MTSSLLPRSTALALVALLCALAVACDRDQARRGDSTADPGEPRTARSMILYSGRAESLIGPIIDRFQKEHGIAVKVKYGGTSELAALLLEEGSRTPAAAFFAQDVGAVGALARRGLLAELPPDLLERVPAVYRAPAGTWVGVSGRVRTLVYNPGKVMEAELPGSVMDLTAPRWKGRVGWAPQNASFQVFVTGLRISRGEEAARQWVTGMKKNRAREYPKNGPIVQAVASGEIDLGLVNHYYLLQFQADDPGVAARNHFMSPGDPGSLVNLSAFAVLKGAPGAEARAAEALGRYLLSAGAQGAFARETSEYPLVEGVPPPDGLPPLHTSDSPVPDLGALDDLEGTLTLLRKTGVLP